MDLSKILNPEESPQQPQPPQHLQPGQVADNNRSHTLPGLHSLSLLGTKHYESSSLPTVTVPAWQLSTREVTLVKETQNASPALTSTSQDLNVPSISSLIHRPAHDQAAYPIHPSDSIQKLNQGLNETLFRKLSTTLRLPSMPLLNSAAPDGVHRHSIDTNTSSPGPVDSQISPTSTVPSLIPDDEEGHETEMAKGSPSDAHQNQFTPVNNSWVHPTHGHDHDEVLPLARTGNGPDDVFQLLLSDEDKRNMEHEVPDDGTPGPRCSYMVDNGKICNLPDPQGRKVISQIFGRNKASTRAIGDGMYIMWCRKHYQRARYRQNTLKNYGTVQCNLLIGVLQRMIDSGAVDSFTITLRLREHERRYWANEFIPPSTKPRAFKPKVEVKRDPNMRAAPKIQGIPVPDYMLPYCGENKTFDDVKAMIGELRENNTREQIGVGTGPQICIESWPDIELLPNINPSWNAPSVGRGDGDDKNDNTPDKDDEGGNPHEGSSAGKKRMRAAGKDGAPSAKKSKTASASTKARRGGKGKSKAAATSSEDVTSNLAAEILASMSTSPPGASRMSSRQRARAAAAE